MKRTLVALLAVVALAGCGQGGSAPPRAHVAGMIPATDTTGWRAESYHRVQLRVPPSWVLGVSPLPGPKGAASYCGVGPSPFGGATSAPYVGRPVLASDACGVPDGGATPPEGDAVWFASPLRVGQSGDAVTVRAGDQRVTVQARDRSLRDAILGSITTPTIDANGCPTEQHVSQLWPREGLGRIRRLAVCLYDGGPLIWSQARPAVDGRWLWRAFAHGNVLRSWPMPPQTSRQAIVLRVTGDDPAGGGPVTVDLVVRLDPARISSPVGSVTLQPGVVRPWASTGIRLYARGPGPDEPSAAYFQPLLG